jgi:hypothetical protein
LIQTQIMELMSSALIKNIMIIFVNFFDLIFYYEKFYQVFIDRDKMFFI